MKKLFAAAMAVLFASSASAQIISSPSGISAQAPQTPGGRLTLSSTAPVMTIDNNVATTIYYLPYVNQYAPVYNGTYWVEDALPSGISLVLDTTHQASGNVFDIYLVLNSGTPELCAMSWGGTTSRSPTAGGFTGAANATVTQVNGIWVNNAAIASGNCYGNSLSYAIPQNQGTYLGSFYANSSGQATVGCKPAANAGGSGAANLYLWNTYNRVAYSCSNRDSATGVTNNSATWTKIGASENIHWLDGLQQSPVKITILIVAGDGTVGDCGYIGGALDSSTGTPNVFGATCAATSTLANNYQTVTYTENLYPLLGKHFIEGMSYAAAGTLTMMPVANQEIMTLDLSW